MAIRTRAVYPDVAYQLTSGETIGVVSEELLQDEAAKAISAAYLTGGIVQVVQDRAPTGVPHEMVCVGALIQWQDRTDAKPQPEPASPAPAAPVVEEPEPVDEFDAAAALKAAAADLGLEVTFAPLADPDPEPAALEAQLAVQADELDEEQQARELHDDVPIPAGAVVMGAPVGANIQVGAAAPAAAAPISPEREKTRVERERGQGSGALPFQKGDQPGDPPRPVEGGVNLAEIAHGDSSLPSRGAEPAPAASSEGIDDGFVPEADEDLSMIPEHLR